MQKVGLETDSKMIITLMTK